MTAFTSFLLFIFAGFLEVGGGYLVWIWFKQDKPLWYGITGFVLLAAYGFIPVLQSTNFGRVYAAYGGIFIGLSVLWGWNMDKIIPDRFDILGSLICLLGVFIILLPNR